jgi:hypothetical protein
MQSGNYFSRHDMPIESTTVWTILGVGAAWLGILAKWLSWSVTTSMRVQLADFKEEIRKEFTDKFQDSRQLALMLKPVTDEMANLRAHINEVEKYAHDWRHAHAGPIQRCVLKLGIESSKDEF